MTKPKPSEIVPENATLTVPDALLKAVERAAAESISIKGPGLTEQEQLTVKLGVIRDFEEMWRKEVQRRNSLPVRLLTRVRGFFQLQRRAAGTRTASAAVSALDFLSMLVPKRIANEEIGDALEQINAMVRARRPRWFINVKVATTFFWVTVHTLLHYAERVAGIIGKTTGGKGD